MKMLMNLSSKAITSLPKVLNIKSAILFVAGFCLGWQQFVAAGVLLFLGIILARKAAVEYWWIPGTGVILGVVWTLSHGWIMVGLGILILLCVFFFGAFLWTLHAFTGKTPILDVKVKKTADDQSTISLETYDKKRNVKKTYIVEGTKWGISANVVLFSNWIVFWGGKTFYRLHSVVGVAENRLDKNYIHGNSQLLWDEFEKSEGTIPGVRAVYEDLLLKRPIDGREYTIYIDNDGALVPELKQ